MVCDNCGCVIKPGQNICFNCGNRVDGEASGSGNVDWNELTKLNRGNGNEAIRYTAGIRRDEKNEELKSTVLIAALVAVVIVFVVIIIMTQGSVGHYFYDVGADISIGSTSVDSSQYSTAVVADIGVSGITVNNTEEAYNLIKESSMSQKDINYPRDILEIENNIINKYGITSVNLRELDYATAKEVEGLIEFIYKNYPTSKNLLTNLTLANSKSKGMEDNAIADFNPVFIFAVSDTATTRPWIIKSQMHLGAEYYLNTERLELIAKQGEDSNYFPKNANSTSTIAHEFGHYLSFCALLKSYSTSSIVVVRDNQIKNFYKIQNDYAKGTFAKKMLDEAYQNDTRSTGYSILFDDWRAQISECAVAKDNKGNYIYDETIAEAFHDVYLNREGASSASQAIMRVVKKYIGK